LPDDTRESELNKLQSLKELALLFLRLGTTAFGGPAAHIAMMDDEVVRRRKWLSHEEFLDLLGAVNLIPGPNSTEMAIHIGRLRAGLAGIIIAGVCFILPAMLIVTAIAWAYMRYGSLPEVTGVLYGIKPVMIAIILQALWGLRRAAFKSKFLALVGVIATAASFAGVNELIVLLGTGLFVAVAKLISDRMKPLRTPSTLAGVIPFGLLSLFLFFLKVGAVLFGSGYVLIAFLHSDLVLHYGWLTQGRLLDAIAVGQVTPGPVFTTATFIGYVLAGIPGAIIATVGIFLPSFFYVGLTTTLIPRLRKSAVAGAFLDGVNVCALALMVYITCQLGRAAIIDVPTVIIAAVSAALLLTIKLNSTWLIIGGALVGLLVKWIILP